VSDPSPDIIVVGSHAPGLRIDVDTFPQPGETIVGHSMTWPVDGGKGTNQAIAAADLGANVAFVGCVGRDGLGDGIADLLRDRNVDIEHLRRSHTTATGCGINIIDDRGTPEMITILGANAELTNQDVSAALDHYRRAKVVLTQMEIDPQVALYAARLGRSHGATSIVNVAPAITLSLSPADSAATIDILVVNEVEAATLDGTAGSIQGVEAAVAARLRIATGIGTVIITLGERGLVAEDGDGPWSLAGAQVLTVDTSGAGDVFCAALAVGIAQGRSTRQACTWANLAASISVTRAGTIPSFPSREEVDLGAATRV
jgi:ribokinase